MSEQIVQVADAAIPTKNMRTIQQTVGGNTVQSEVVVLAKGLSNGSDLVDPTSWPDLQSTGSISSTPAAVTLAVTGRMGASVQIAGTYTGVLQIQESSDNGATWVTFLLVYNLTTNFWINGNLAANLTGTFIVPTLAGLNQIRVNASSLTSGTANITITATTSPLSQPTPGVYTNNAATSGQIPSLMVTGGIDTSGFLRTRYVNAINANPAGTEYGFVTRNIPSGTQPVSGTVTANAGTGTFTVSQNLLGASDQPDVTVNHTGTLPVNVQNTTRTIVDPYTGTAARVDATGNLLTVAGTSPNYSSATEPNFVSGAPQYAPLNPASKPIQSNPMIGYNGYRKFQ